MTTPLEPQSTIVDATPRTGNRCGHDKHDPQWDKIVTPEVRGSLPLILGDMVDNAIEYYTDPSALLPLASVMNGKERGQSKYRGKNNDGSMRKSRSEAREAEVLVMVAIILHMDVTSLRVGTPQKGDRFLHRSCKELAGRVSLIDPKTQRPNRRFQRAFKRLQEAGLLNVDRVACQDKHGKIIQTSAVKSVSEDFAVLLLGGSEKDRQRLRKARESHSRATRAQRGRAPLDQKDLERKALASKIDHSNRTKKTAAAISKAAGFKLTGPEYEAMYEQAKDAHLSAIRATGDFKATMEAMRNFPALGEWRP